jgi:hypothetical protein
MKKVKLVFVFVMAPAYWLIILRNSKHDDESLLAPNKYLISGELWGSEGVLAATLLSAVINIENTTLA